MSWIAPINDLSQLDKESAKFVFDSAEKRLKHLIEMSDRTTNRAIAILTALIPLVAFLLSGLYKHFFGTPNDVFSCQSLLVSILSIVVCLTAMSILGFVAFPRDMHQMGREPNLLYIDELVNNDAYKDEMQYKLFLVAETEDFQKRIDFMQSQSDFRVKLLKRAFLIIISYFLLCLIFLAWQVLAH